MAARLPAIIIRIVGENASAKAAVGEVKSELSTMGATARAATQNIGGVNATLANTKTAAHGLSGAWSGFIGGANTATGSAANLHAQLQKIDDTLGKIQNARFSNLENAANTARNVGIGLTATGIASGAVLGKSATDADEMARLRKSLVFSIGSEAGADAAIGWLKEFDRNSPFDLRETAAQFKNLLGKGFSEEAAKSILTKVGDVVSRTGGTTENLSAVIRQMSQIQGKGKASAQDINAISEGGGVPITQILQSQLSPERYKSFMAGEQQLTADEFFKAFDEGAKRYSGGMKEANDSLAGSFSNLQSAFYQLSASMGESLLPAVTAGVKVLTGAVDLFNQLPGPIKAVIAYGALFGAGLLIIGGGILTAVGVLAGAALSIYSFGIAVGLIGTGAGTAAIGVGGLGAALTGTLIPAILSVGVALAAAAAVAALTAAAVYYLSGAYDANKKAAEDKVKGDAAEEESLRLTNERRKKRGLAPIASQAGRENELDTDGSGNPMADTAQKAQADLAKIAATNTTGAPAATSQAVFSIAPGASSAFPSLATSGATGEENPNIGLIRGLQDAIRAAKGKENKEKREALQAQLVTAQRASQDWNKAHAAQVKAGKQSDKENEERVKGEIEDERRQSELTQLRKDSTVDAQIEALSEELEAAREEADAAKVYALTRRIALMEARKKYDSAMAQAAITGLSNEKEADFQEEKAAIELGDDTRKAEQSARKARKSVEDGDGEGAKKKRDAATRALLALTIGARPGAATSAIGGSPMAMMSGTSGRDVYDLDGNLVERAQNRFGGELPQIGGGVSMGALFPSLSRGAAPGSRGGGSNSGRVGSRVSIGREDYLVEFEPIKIPRTNDFDHWEAVL